MTALRNALIALLLSILPSTAAWAQFPGDSFFETPSVQVEEGGEVDLTLIVFAGGEVLGATEVAVTYNPAELELVSVTPAGTEELADVFAVDHQDGRSVIVTANSQSLSAPTASVAVATLRVRPLAGEGARLFLGSEMRGALDVNGVTFLSSDGFGAEINVVAPASASSAGVATPAFAPSELPTRLVADRNVLARAAALRPEGTPVEMYLDAGGNRLERVLVVPRANGAE